MVRSQKPQILDGFCLGEALDDVVFAGYHGDMPADNWPFRPRLTGTTTMAPSSTVATVFNDRPVRPLFLPISLWRRPKLSPGPAPPNPPRI